MTSLTSKQRKHLRGLAHALDPVVHIGKGGLTDEVVRQIDRALDVHELVKVRIVAGKEEKDELIGEACERLGAAAAGIVGHVAILFRRQADPEKRRIHLA